MASSVFISTTIPYVNAPPHLGHALEFVQADSYARYFRALGDDVFFLSGSDENSLKNVLAAEREGITTRELVDRNVEYFEGLRDRLDLSWDYFIRTSADSLHLRGAAEIWSRIDRAGDVYRKAYTGLYCVGCEQFYTEAELIDGKCPEHETEPDLISEENHFFRLSRYGELLESLISTDEVRVVPETRKKEALSFIRSGLADISISRSHERARGWGIPVPGDPTQVMYVWIDALTNYVTALGWVDDDPKYEHFWADADRRIHVVGKGVIRFHAVYWLAMLLSAGLPLPTEIVVHGYVTSSGRKLSKSLGNSVDPVDVAERYGTDTLRYYLLADIPTFADGDFNEERLFRRRNSDLANELGNLVSRVTSMVGRYRAGRVPTGQPGEPEERFRSDVDAIVDSVDAAMERFDARDAIQNLWRLVRRANVYLDECAPWHLAKAEDARDPFASVRLDATLSMAAAATRLLGARLEPFMPASSRVIVESFGIGSATVPNDWTLVVDGAEVRKPPPLFTRLDVMPE